MSGDGEHHGGWVSRMELDRVSSLHVAAPTDTSPVADGRKYILSSRLSFSPPAMAVFPLAFFILSLSLLVCAADLYKVLQG
jgi:hypothetical protein